MKNILYSTLLLSILGCTTLIPPTYSSSAKNVVELKDLYGNSSNKIKVGEFTTEINSVSCRGAYIGTPDRLAIAMFIKNGFSDELKLAGVYSKDSNIELRAKIINFDVACNADYGTWTTEMEITIGQNEPFIVKDIYKFEGSIIGDAVLHNAMQSLTPALQNIYGLIAKHPNFKVVFDKAQ